MGEIESGGYSEEKRPEAEKFNEMVDTGELARQEVSEARKNQSPMDVLIDKKHEEANKFHEMHKSGEATAEDLEKSLGPVTTPEQFIEILNRQKEGRVLNYLCGIPGTTSHNISRQEDYEILFELVKRGQSIEKEEDKSKRQGAWKERFISLNVARWDGDNNAVYAHGYGWAEWKLPAHGFALKPEFFLDKIANITEEAVIQAKEAGDFFASGGHGRVSHKLEQSIAIRKAILEKKRPDAYYDSEAGEIRELHYDSDIGIRGVTVKNGKFVPAPIMAEDIECFFEIDEE